MRKKVIVFLLIFLSLTFFKTQNNQVNAAVYPGDTCSTKGATTYINGLLYTCTCQIREYNCTWTTTATVPISTSTPIPTPTTAPASTNTPIPTNTPVSTDFCINYNDIYMNQCENYTLWSSDSPLCYTTDPNVTLYNTISDAIEFRYVQTSTLCDNTDLTNIDYEPRVAAKNIALTGDFGKKRICAEFKLANGQTDKCATLINYIESASPLENTPTPVLTNAPAATSTPAPTNTPIPTITQAPDCPLKSKGDANCDEKIDTLDFNIWKCQMNTIDASCGAPVQAANFDLLNGVNINDYEIWRRTYQMNLAIEEITPPPTDTPTPTDGHIDTPTKILSPNPTLISTPTPITNPTNTPICCKSGCGCEFYDNITTCPLITDKDLNTCTYEFSCRYDPTNYNADDNGCVKDTSGSVPY